MRCFTSQFKRWGPDCGPGSLEHSRSRAKEGRGGRGRSLAKSRYLSAGGAGLGVDMAFMLYIVQGLMLGSVCICERLIWVWRLAAGVARAIPGQQRETSCYQRAPGPKTHFGSAAGDVLASCGCKAAESGELLWCVAGKEDCDT